jgi:hypothetical protein
MQTTPIQAGELSGQVLMYNKPEPLSIEAHGDLGLISSDRPFAFAFAANAVPVLVTEFGPASINYPIIFAGDDRTPLAIMSVRPNENLFITEGRFDPEAYIPAFIRRYPFVTASNPQNEQMIVCIDTSAGFLTKNGGDVKLFENGEPSEYTKNAIEFCKNFEMERQRTESFVALLKELDLLEERKQTITPANDDGTPGEPIELSDYFAVSEAKLAALPGDKLVQLRDTGALQQIYAHLLSLPLWERLVTKTLQRFPQETAGNA